MWGTAKAPHNFSAKNIAAIDFVNTDRLNKSSINDFVELSILWTTGPWKLKVERLQTVGHNITMLCDLYVCMLSLIVHSICFKVKGIGCVITKLLKIPKQKSWFGPFKSSVLTPPVYLLKNWGFVLTWLTYIWVEQYYYILTILIPEIWNLNFRLGTASHVYNLQSKMLL